MEIKKLFERDGIQSQTPSVQRSRATAAYDAQREGNTARRATEDSVSISPLSRQLVHLSDILADDQVKRSDKIAQIKSSVEAGQYAVDSHEVARSLVSFAADASGLI